MSWTDITRQDYACSMPRYASDLSDAEWAVIEPLLPKPNSIGRPRPADLREVMNAILYMASTGCQRRMLPKDFTPFTTVQNYFYAWRDSRLLWTINNSLVMAAREKAGREASPTAGEFASMMRDIRHGGAVPIMKLSPRKVIYSVKIERMRERIYVVSDGRQIFTAWPPKKKLNEIRRNMTDRS